MTTSIFEGLTVGFVFILILGGVAGFFINEQEKYDTSLLIAKTTCNDNNMTFITLEYEDHYVVSFRCADAKGFVYDFAKRIKP